jgi:hypothetical protein
MKTQTWLSVSETKKSTIEACGLSKHDGIIWAKQK